MELELKKVPMAGYICPLDTTLYQEETQEMIVPDACPDILEIVSTECSPLLKRKEAQEGRYELEGVVRAIVLYRPEGEAGLRRLELHIPFRNGGEVPGLRSGCPMVVCPRVIAADTRILNPRKVLCRVELAITLQTWLPMEGHLCSSTHDCGEASLQELTEGYETYGATAIGEKPFSFSDDVTISGSRPGAAELLKHRLELLCNEARVIGNKLIFKGEANLHVFYRDEQGGMNSSHWELPFSQIMEVNGAGEESQCTLELAQMDSTVALGDDTSGRTLSVHLELLAQAVVRETQQVTLLTDAYSVVCPVEVDWCHHQFYQMCEEGGQTETQREIVEIMPQAKSVEDVFLTLGQPQLTVEDEKTRLTAQGKVNVLYMSEEGQLTALVHPIVVGCRVTIPEGGKCVARCRVGGEVVATPTAGGLELRCPVHFTYLITTQRQATGVSGLRTLEASEEGGERPSIVLRMAGEDERLWDIAKAYATTTQDIMQANDLTEQSLYGGTLLLIPKNR